MKIFFLLLTVFCLCWRTEAQSGSYLIAAPRFFRLDAMEKVVVQLFGFTDEVMVHLFLKTSMAPTHKVLAREVVKLNAQNSHQNAASIRLHPNQLDKSMNNVILHVQSPAFSKYISVPVSRTNGFLFIQTDKPLYTPLQSVKVRAFSLNQELRPANRNVFLTFKDPEHTTVDIVEMSDVNNGIPSMQNPFKIPIKPKLGIWTIEASYSDDFTTHAKTDFEVKEYVLPSFSILVEPKTNYISHNQFTHFEFKVSARYLHGAPVADGVVFLRYGYVSGNSPAVIFPRSISKQILSSKGERDVIVNIQDILSRLDGPLDLNDLVGKYLYIAVLLEERTGGLTQEAEFASVKFVKSPYTLRLVSTPPFIKPGLPYKIQVVVKDHLGKPVKQVPIRVTEGELFFDRKNTEVLNCSPDVPTSQSDGLAFLICNTQAGASKAVLKNYARWVSVFIRDLESLPSSIQEEFEAGHWTISQSNHRYSSIPIDQAHEQANKQVKGVGGVIGITENPEMLECWIATGPEISQVLEQFSDVDDDGGQELPHHEEGSTSQHHFRRHVTNLMDVLQSRGNPFEESSADLVTLDYKVCVDKSAATSVRVLESRGEEQYDHFRKNVLDTNNVPLQAPIKKNKFLLFHEEKTRKKTAVQKKVQHFEQHADLYGQAFIMVDSRGGNLEEFFRHESSSSPPALASEGSINSCKKSDLLACIMEASASTGLSADAELVAPDDYGVIVIDGGALIHSLPGTTVQGKTFAEYFTKVFCPRIQHEWKRAARFETNDPTLPAESQATLELTAVAYHSPNERYLYVDAPAPGTSLEVGRNARLEVFSQTPSYIAVKAISYLVISRGKVVHFNTQPFFSRINNREVLTFQVTPEMVPSIRVLVYYILFGEGLSELVADSVWVDVKAKCVNGLQTDMNIPSRPYKPKELMKLNIRTSHDGLVALSAVDTAMFVLRPNYKDPVTRVLHHIEHSDQGCGGGGGKDAADVFRLAGLSFITNAHSQALSSVNSFGPYGKCCEAGMKYIPKSLTCDDYAKQQFKDKSSSGIQCREIFKHCCKFIQSNIGLNQDLILARNEFGDNFDMAPSLVRSYFPESWLWEVQETSSAQLTVSKTLPDSLTTWEFKAVGMFKDGICVAEPVQVSVNLPLNVDIPLPYQVVRGEQLELRGSVYNQQFNMVEYCVTLMVGPAVCLLGSTPVGGDSGNHITGCKYNQLPPGGVDPVDFTILGLEAGEHTLTFTLRNRRGAQDILEKKLRVVPEGMRREVYSGGKLDPQGVYGVDKLSVELKNQIPINIVPNTEVERVLTINGEVLGEMITVVHDPNGLRKLINVPPGSAEAELGSVLPLIQLFQYLERAGSWGILGPDIIKNAGDLKQKIREGLVSISSFRRGDFSYSRWRRGEPSTWHTALAVKTLAAADAVFSGDRQSLSTTISWLVQNAQNPDGSFTEKSNFRANKILVGTVGNHLLCSDWPQAEGTSAADQSVYLTSFVLIALHRATRIKDQILHLQSFDQSRSSAAAYISQHALNVKSVHVRAVATYALTLYDPNSFKVQLLIRSLENLALQKGHPATLRYWKESDEKGDWLKPDQSSGLTVETTAYVLLTILLKVRLDYANPILAWLTQDQHYGQGIFSIQDIVLTLEALTEYRVLASRSALDQEISIRYQKKGSLGTFHLTQSRPVARPVMVTKNDDVIVSTGYGKGVSNVKIKTVFYQTMASTQSRCNFDLTVEVVGAGVNPALRSPHLVACAQYKPPPNEVFTESSLTVMEIQIPTGVEAILEDLRQFTDTDPPLVSHYELDGSTVVVQMEAVPSDMFVCVGFRLRTGFEVRGRGESQLTVKEPQDKGSVCTKTFYFQNQELQRLCVGEQCQCMRAACAVYRGNIDLSLTGQKRRAETCRPHIKYAYRVKVKSSSAEGDFMTHTATIEQVIKNTHTDLEAVRRDSEVELVRKVTCSDVNIQTGQQYLVIGASGIEVKIGTSFKYRLPLDSDTIVELWPTDCRSAPPSCSNYITQLNAFALDMMLIGC
ncbi:complement C5 [Pholidichthys leucotaenia]